MFHESYRSQFFEAKKLYKKIRKLHCPAFNNECVYFTRAGFEHLIRKGRKLRSIDDQLRRFRLLKKVTSVIGHGKIIERRIESTTLFVTLGYQSGNKFIKVIVRQKSEGKKYFVSIMDE